MLVFWGARALLQVAHLALCPKIHELNLAENQLHDSDALMAVLQQLPELEVRLCRDLWIQPRIHGRHCAMPQ